MVGLGFVPAEWLAPCRACNVNGDAIIFPKAAYGGPVLVLNAGKEQRRFYLGGAGEFELLTDDGAADFAGVAIEGVGIELGLEWAEYIGGASARLGSFVRVEEHLEFCAKTPARLSSVISFKVRSGLPYYTKHEKTIFPHWRIVKMNGKEKVTLWATGQMS